MTYADYEDLVALRELGNRALRCGELSSWLDLKEQSSYSDFKGTVPVRTWKSRALLRARWKSKPHARMSEARAAKLNHALILIA